MPDRSNLIQTLEVMFGSQYTDEYTVYDHATDIQDLIEGLPGKYEYPLLTFNAFATKAKEEMGIESSIIIGEGYFTFQESIGLSSEGPEYAMTHEYTHHIQFALDNGEKYEPSQHAKREELAADTLAAYFLAYDDGGRMSAIKISNIHAISYSVGDCSFNDDGHHGTPSQRGCATKFGASLSEQDDDLELIDLQNRFNRWYENVDDLNDLCQYSISGASTSLLDRSLIFGMAFVGMFAF